MKLEKEIAAKVFQDYRGILSQNQIDATISWWIEKARWIRNEAIEESRNLIMDYESDKFLQFENQKDKLLAFEIMRDLMDEISSLKRPQKDEVKR